MALELHASQHQQGNGNNHNQTETNFMEALELEHLIGMSCNYTNSFLVAPTSTSKYIYSIGPTLIVDDHAQNAQNQLMLRNHNTPISCLAVSPCGNLLASGQRGSHLLKNTAIVNLYYKYKLVHSFHGLYNGVHKVLFTPDSKFLVATDLNGLFIIWDCKTFETILAKQMTINDHKQSVNIDSCHILDFAQDENFQSNNSRHNVYQILVSYACNLYMFTLRYSVKHMEYIIAKQEKFLSPANRPFNRILSHLDSVQIDDSTFLVAATTNVGEIYLFTSSKDNHVYTHSFQACSQGANVAVFIDANHIVIGGGDGSLKQFAFRPSKQQWDLVAGIQLDSSVNTLQFVQHENLLYATTIHSNAYKVDMKTFSFALLFQSPFDSICQIQFGTFPHIFATLTSSNAILTIWDLSSYLRFAEITYPNGNGTTLHYHGEDQILCGLDNGTIICNRVHFKAKAHESKIQTMWQIQHAHRGKVNCIEICSDSKGNKLLLTGGDDGLLNVWNLNTHQLISQHHVMIEGVLNILKDCKYAELVHLLGSNGQIVTFSLKREGIIIRRIIKQNRYNVGRLTDVIQDKNDEFQLISSSMNGFLLIWDHELTELQEAIDCKKITGNDQLQILSIALSNNSKYLCFGNNIGEIFIVCMKSKKLITKCEIHSNQITSIAWTPDDKQIITSSGDSSIAVSNFYT